MFEEFNDVQPAQKGDYLNPGEYLAEIETVKHTESRQSGTGFAVRFRILQTNNETDHPVDSRADFFRQLSKAKYPDANMADVVAFFFGLAGADPKTRPFPIRTSAIMQSACSAENPLRGLTVRIKAWKKDGKDWTNYSFSCVDPSAFARVCGASAPPAAPAAEDVPCPPGFRRLPDGSYRPI